MKNLNLWTTGPIFSHGQQLAGAEKWPSLWMRPVFSQSLCHRNNYWFIVHRYLGGMLIIIHLATCFVIFLHRTHFTYSLTHLFHLGMWICKLSFQIQTTLEFKSATNWLHNVDLISRLENGNDIITPILKSVHIKWIMHLKCSPRCMALSKHLAIITHHYSYIRK